MTTRSKGPRRSLVSPEQARAALSERLRARRSEIEQATLTRIYAVSAPTEVTDPAYAEGLRTAVCTALDYALAGIEAGSSRPSPIPVELFAQARLAARNGVNLDTVLRRYFAGHTLLGDFVIQEAGSLLPQAELQRLLKAQAALVDRLMAAVTEEYTREAKGRPETAEERRTEWVERLLDGEPLDTTELAYDFDAHHVGVIVAGSGAAEAFRDLAAARGSQHLTVRRGEDTVWAWLGTRRRLDPAELAPGWPAGVFVAVGEPAQGLLGWRLTHRQAAAALPIALRSHKPYIRYADVPVLASIHQDDLLAASLRELYLAPLEEGREEGKMARETLRAYFAADRNVSSAAAALEVDRHTVTSRLRTIEERLGAPLSSCAFDLEAALQLEELGYPASSKSASSRS